MAHIRDSLLLVALLIPRTALATDFSGSVVSVLDGDTIEVLHSTRAERIRLNGIDCPEKGQAYGKRVKQAASELVFGKQVTLETFGKDKYGRTIADVLLPDGGLERLETEARGAKRGFWKSTNPIAPWLY
jgi:endonuclease YncB( thermonuclease family)